MNQDFQDIKNEFDKWGSEAGESVAQRMYEALATRLAPFFFNQESINKRTFRGPLKSEPQTIKIPFAINEFHDPD